jgi:hypothetical protein
LNSLSSGGTDHALDRVLSKIVSSGEAVNEDDRLRRVLDRGAEDFARMNQAAVKRADAYQMGPHNLKLNIQGDNMKFLLGRITLLAGKLVTAGVTGRPPSEYTNSLEIRCRHLPK